MRQDIAFTSHGITCRGWLDRPDASTGQRIPLVLMAHGFGATRDMHLEQYAQRFNASGYATLIFDYRHFGASDGEPRNLLDPFREIEDWHAALAYVRSLPDIDTQRIALWGTSFAGGLVICVAAQDGDVAATVSQCPMLDGLGSALEIVRYDGILGLAKLSARGVTDGLRSLLGLPPTYVPIVAPPGSVGMMTTADAWAMYTRLAPPGFRNEVTARTALQVPRFRPITDAPRVKCPALLVVCDNDTVAPAAIALKAAARIPKAEVVRFPVGHFDVYFNEDFERSVSAMNAFLRKHLGKA